MDEKLSTILVADDDPGNRALLEKMLSSAGYEIILAEDGPEVLEIIKEKTPDLFLLDILMPEMDGLEVCKHLKRDEWL